MVEGGLGFEHFLEGADVVARLVLVILAVMSIATWYLLIAKLFNYWRMRDYGRRFLKNFWESSDLGQVNRYLDDVGVHDPYSHLTHHGLRAAEQFHNRSGSRLIESGSADEFLTRALRRAVAQDTARLEYGLTVLASVASSAPFVGLFGTVWGIYHALINIGGSGIGTLDQVAGPVGEALIMTALGLAVAIPAVLVYNGFNRANRLMLAEIDGFAHDLFAFMATGICSDNRVATPVGAAQRLRSV